MRRRGRGLLGFSRGRRGLRGASCGRCAHVAEQFVGLGAKASDFGIGALPVVFQPQNGLVKPRRRRRIARALACHGHEQQVDAVAALAKLDGLDRLAIGLSAPLT